MAFNWKDWLAQSENQRLLAIMGVAAMGAYGAKGDRDFAREQQQQNRGDSLLDRQRAGYLDRADSLNNLTQNQFDDEFRGASSAASMTNPFDYKRELQRDVNRGMGLTRAAQMLGMPTSNLFKEMNTDNSILQRNANAVMLNEMNAQDVNPTRQARDISQSLGMGPMQSALMGQQNQLNQYSGMAQDRNAGMRQGMVDNTTNAYNQYDKSIADQIAQAGKIDPATGNPKKTSKWRSILGNVVKYGGAAAAIGLTGGLAAPAVAGIMAGTSLAGDKIAGKGWKEAALGAATSAIPGGTGALGSSLTKGISNKFLQAAAQQGLRAAGENIPYAGPALQFMDMKNGVPGRAPAMPVSNTPAPKLNTPQMFPATRNPWGNVRFGGR